MTRYIFINKKHIPLWVKILYTIFVAVFIPVYYIYNGWANFLWFSDLAIFTTFFGMWLENSLLISMTALSVVVFELIWNFGFFVGLITRWHPFNLTQYMFVTTSPLLLRSVSLFHVFLPFLLLWLLYRLGYDKRAIYWQTCFAWVLLLICYFFTLPTANINFVFYLGATKFILYSPLWHIILGMLLLPIVIYLPSHFVFKKLFFKCYYLV